MSHPSFLALDRHALEPQAAVASHLEGCASCRAHVEAVQRALPLPGWLEKPPVRRRLWPGALALAGAAAALLLTLTPAAPPATTAKGGPGVTVWLRRGSDVARWDGARALRAGDAFRLELSGEGYAHAAVVRGAEVLFRAPAPSRATMTPAWELDAEPGDERLLVVYSQQPLEGAQVPGLVGRRDAEVWSVELVLRKER